MRIATWNVAYGRGPIKNNRRREQFDRVDADVWVLTETHDSLAPGDMYQSAHAAQRPLGSAEVVDGSRWVSIWTRLPILERDLGVADPERTVACLIDTGGEPLLVFGTVLPWTHDTERAGMEQELTRQAADWEALQHRFGTALCVAGDLNVNLGGPHYYGSAASKAAVATAVDGAGLVTLTDYEHTKQIRQYGLIDHIAISKHLARVGSLACLWERRNVRGEEMSDHSGVAIDIGPMR